MVQGFYTLQEAAQFLGISEEKVRKRAEAKSLRTFMDRGTLRFRVQDIQEIAREMGLSSEPELALGDASLQKSGSGAARSGLTPRSGAPRRSGLAPKSEQPPSGVKQPKSSGRTKAPTPEVFDFDLGAGELDELIDVGRERPSSVTRKSQLKAAAPPPAPKSNPRKSRLKPGSDSEIRLVNEGSDLSLTADSGADSNIKVGQDSAARKQGGAGSKASPRPKPKSKLSSDSQPIDSGIRLVPMDNSAPMSTSSEEIPLGVQPPPSGEDSDVRLELPKNPSRLNQGMIQTDEIDLDRELQQAPAPREARLKPKSTLQFSNSSPFELSDDDIPSPSKSGTVDSSDFDLQPTADSQSGSSDFDLQPSAEDGTGTTDFEVAPGGIGIGGNESADFQLTPDGSSDFSLSPDGSTDFNLDASAEEPQSQTGSSGFELGEESGSTDLGDMSLELSAEDVAGFEENAVDTGLTFGGDEDMSLMLENTPKPAPRQNLAPESESEFELSLDDGTGSMAGDSEFELTLDDGAATSDMQVKAEGEHIFDSDFEVPALDESGSEVANIDTDLESSDFDLALDESDAALDDESASQVIALEEEQSFEGEVEELVEELDELGGVDDQGFGELDDAGAMQEVEGESGPAREVIVEKFIEPAPWGAIPVLFMVPCTVVTIVLGIMGYEMVQSSNGFRPAGPVTKMVAGLFGKDLK